MGGASKTGNAKHKVEENTALDEGGEAQGQGKEHQTGDEEIFSRDGWAPIDYVRYGEQEYRTDKSVEEKQGQRIAFCSVFDSSSRKEDLDKLYTLGLPPSKQ